MRVIDTSLTGSFILVWQSDNNPGCMLGENQMHPKKVTETKRQRFFS